ncbi:hypothetical protein AALA69_03080 [Eggerthellaceae bacterium 24-137]
MKKTAIVAMLSGALALCLAGCSAPQEKLETDGASISYPAEWTGDVHEMSSDEGNGKVIGIEASSGKMMALDLDGEAMIVVAKTTGDSSSPDQVMSQLESSGITAEMQGDKMTFSGDSDGMHLAGTAIVDDGKIAAVSVVTADDSAWQSNADELQATADSLTT